MNLTWSALLCATLTVALPVSQAHAEPKTPEERELETRLEAANGAVSDAAASPISADQWSEAAGRLGAIASAPELEDDCVDARYAVFGGKYAISYDGATGAACKLYDLSFPTLRARGKTLSVSALPTQKYTAKDYLEWIKGNDDQVSAKARAFQATPAFLPASSGAEADWMSAVRFKDGAGFAAAPLAFGARRLPKSFHASDLDVGRRFDFPARDKERLKALIGVLERIGAPEATVRAWAEVAAHPRGFLEKVRFDYNDAKKVYDIALDADFLPFNGPVALIDFKTPYKPAVERLIRSVLGASLRSLARVIPNQTARSIVNVAIEDSFEFIEMAYSYQYTQFEDTLRAAMDGRAKSDLKPAELQSMLDLAFGVRSNLMSQYVMALAQGQKFDWTQIEKIGKRARYDVEKARDVTMNETNSRLVLKNGCEMRITDSYFGVCSREGRKVALYSLTSRHSVLLWSFGAPVVHKYDTPNEVTMKRGFAYLLAVGVRVANIGIGHRFSYMLSDALKGFARNGALDEAILKNRLWLEKRGAGELDAENQKLLSTLYVQNLNPFLAHSEASEAKFIRANAQALEIPETVSPAVAGLE